MITELTKGDRVYWTDPDNGECSRYYVIKSITIDGEVVTIQEPDGSYLECFSSELGRFSNE